MPEVHDENAESRPTSIGADDDDEHDGILSPLSIESSPAGYSSRPPSTARKLLFIVTSCRCNLFHRRTATCLAVSIILVAMCFSMARRFFPTYLPSIPALYGGKSKAPPANAVCLSQPLSGHNRTDVAKMNLNRRAPAFSGSPKSLNGASGGFLWNDGDAKTTKWRPQGVATINMDDGRRFVLVSWYGRKDEGYAERGARISFVDVSEMHSIAALYPYRHVLLVDENFCTLPSIHAGGIEFQNGKLYVADSRKGQQAVLVFDVFTGLYEIPEDTGMHNELFGYRYILRSTSSFHVPIKPSFISYDLDLGQFIVGTYARCGNTIGLHTDTRTCMNKSENRLVWFAEGEVSLTQPNYCSPFFSEMQGAVSARNDTSNKGNSSKFTLWIVSSYGPYADSHLHIVSGFDPLSCTDHSFAGELSDMKTLHYPPGMEDLHIEENKKDERYMWMVTEFGTRMVFSTSLEALF